MMGEGIPCSMCGGPIDFEHGTDLPAGCYSHFEGYPCKDCGRAHSREAEPVYSEHDAPVFFEIEGGY